MPGVAPRVLVCVGSGDRFRLRFARNVPTLDSCLGWAFFFGVEAVIRDDSEALAMFREVISADSAGV